MTVEDVREFFGGKPPDDAFWQTIKRGEYVCIERMLMWTMRVGEKGAPGVRHFVCKEIFGEDLPMKNHLGRLNEVAVELRELGERWRNFS